MKDNIFTNEGNDNEVPKKKTFTKPARNGQNEFIEHEVDRFDYEGFEVVRRESFSKVNCPAITIKYGKVVFNVRAIKKLSECSHVLILINIEKKLIRVKPCDEDDKDSLQWSRIDKHGKLVARAITGKLFTAQLYKDMKWNLECTFKMLGILFKCKDEKQFVFDLANAERYLSLSKPTADNPKRRERVAYIPEHWKESYGQTYEESKFPMVETFEEIDGYVKITLPQLPSQKSAGDKLTETVNLFSGQNVLNTDQSNKREKEAQKDGTT